MVVGEGGEGGDPHIAELYLLLSRFKSMIHVHIHGKVQFQSRRADSRQMFLSCATPDVCAHAARCPGRCPSPSCCQRAAAQPLQ